MLSNIICILTLVNICFNFIEQKKNNPKNKTPFPTTNRNLNTLLKPIYKSLNLSIMFKIVKITLYKLRNGEYFQFMTAFKSLLDILTPAAIHSEEDFTKFNAALTKLDDELRVDKGSVLTEELHAIDFDRDSLWRAIDMRINATLLCTVDKEIEAAKRLRRVFDLYGDIRKISFNEETAGLSNLLGDMAKAENAGFVTTCGLTKWANVLDGLNGAFIAKQNERDTELANKNSGNAKVVRIEMDPLYELMVERVNALVSLNMQTPELENFVRELNQKIKTLEITLAGREGRKDSGEEEPQAEPEVD